MTPRQIELVRSCWQQVLPMRAAVADLFYARLFELAPDTRPLFRRDIHAQGAMLMAALSTVVAQLDTADRVLPLAQALARRHVGYGVRAEHYDSVGSALLWTLERGFGAAFDAERHAAWTAAYALLAGAMVAAAYPPQHPAGASPQAEPST